MIQRPKRGSAKEKRPCKASNLVRAITPCVCGPLTEVVATAIYLEAGRNPKCHDCDSMDIDQTYRKVFKCLVCNKCRNEKVEKYSLLTKTECKEVNVAYLMHTLDSRMHAVRTIS